MVKALLLSSDYKMITYPNPAKDKLNIKYYNPIPQYINISICDVRGVEIRSIAKRYAPSGWIDFNFETADFSPGIYVCIIKTATEKQFQKIVITK